MPGIHDQNLPQSIIEELKLKEESPEWNKHFEKTLRDHFLPKEKGNRVESLVSLAVSSSGAKSELLPCPFCGGEVKLFTYPTGYVISHNNTYGCVFGVSYATENKADLIKDWNKRAKL